VPEQRLATGVEYVAPQTATEIKLAQIWQRVLNLKTVGTQDNFFDLGGHSLLAIRLVSEINKSLDLSLSIPIFFQNPTIEGIMCALETEDHRKSEPKLIPLKPGPPGRALFFLDASMGQCQLAQLLDAGIASFATVVPLPASALRAVALNDENSLPSLEELAATHAMLIQKNQPSGVYLLVGHSFGGLLAFEVAHQLQRQGKIVEMILLLDSWATAPPWWRKLKMLSLARAWNSLQFRISHWYSRRRNSAAGPPTAESALEVANQPIGNIPWEFFHRIYHQARKKYRFYPLDSRALVFCAQHSEMALFYPVSNNLGWAGLLTRGVEVVETPGDHFTLLKEPNLQVLAGHFNSVLNLKQSQ
jgi:thioesterase domain-containing protein